MDKTKPGALQVVGPLMIAFGFLHMGGILGKRGGPFTLAFDVACVVIGVVLVVVSRARRPEPTRPIGPGKGRLGSRRR